MDCSSGTAKQQKLKTDILAFIQKSRGLQSASLQEGLTRIQQEMDGKALNIATQDLEDVLSRSDTEGREFIQVNFSTGKKILITDTLIGFKPMATQGLETTKLPRVVTTPDIVSVFEALQDSLQSASFDTEEIKVLKRVYEAVVAGGEAVGFDLSTEKSWITRIPWVLTSSAS